MVGEEHHGPPVRRHLDRPEHHALAGQLVGCPTQRQWSHRRAADRSGRSPARRCTTCAHRRSSDVTGDPVRARTGPQPQRSGRSAAAACRARAGAPAATPTGRTAPDRTGGGPTHAERVGRPRAEHRLHRDPAGYGDVGPEPRARRTDLQRRPGGHHTAAPNSRGRPSTRTSHRRSGHRHPACPDRWRSPSRRAAPRGTRRPPSLPTRRLARPAACGSSAPARGTPRCAQPGRPRSWTSTDAPHLSHREGHRLTNLTRVPGASRAGSARPGSHSAASVRPMTCQPPGDSPGYTPHHVPANATAPAGTRVRGLARRGTGTSSARQVGEPRSEAAECRTELRRPMACADLVHVAAPVRCDDLEIRAVVGHR